MSSEEATKLKDQGNDFFTRHLYNPAVSSYTKAIEAAPPTDYKLLAVLYGNRSFAQLKMENYGLSIEDATKALQLDSGYVKAYYRRGSSNLVLQKYDEAMKDFKQVVTLYPNDKDARRKFETCQKAIKSAKFAAAIAFEEGITSEPTFVDVESIVVEKDYDGPHLENGVVTLDFVVKLMEHFKNQKNLHKKYCFQILTQVREYFDKQQNVINITLAEDDDKFTVCGDVHGQYYDLLNIFSINGNPSEKNGYLFNGDFVDRGSFSCEVVITMLCWKLLYPNHFYMSRGNHESRAMNKIYGFEGEVKAKYSALAYDLFCEIFDRLPLVHIIGKKIFVVHGGLFGSDNVKIEHLYNFNRKMEPPATGLMADILWTDPQMLPGRGPSKRGVGLSFGPDVTERFLKDNNLDLVIRSHEVKPKGYQLEHNGKLVTLFSAPNYCDQVGNQGAFCVIKKDLVPSYISYDAVPHPNVPPMAYASQMGGLFGL